MIRHTSSAALTLVIAVLLFAMAPSLTYLGHWPEQVVPAGHSHAAATSDGHEAHCHGDVAGCAQGPAAVGVPGLAGNETVAVVPEGVLVAISEVAIAKQTAIADVSTPPPRHSPSEA